MWQTEHHPKRNVFVVVESNVINPNAIPSGHGRVGQNLGEHIQLVLTHRIRMGRHELRRCDQIVRVGGTKIGAGVLSMRWHCFGEDSVVEGWPPRVRFDPSRPKLCKKVEEEGLAVPLLRVN